MTNIAPNRLTLRQRWHRLRTSFRFPFLLFFGLLGAGCCWQGYCFWWGVRIQRMVARHTGHVNSSPPYSDSIRYPKWLKQTVGDKWIRPMESVNGVSLTPNAPLPASDLALLVGTWSLTHLEVWGPMESDGWRQVGRLRNLNEFSVSWPALVVSAGEMEQLEGLPMLWSITLTGTAYELRGVRHFARLPSLKRLGLNGRRPLDRSVAEHSAVVPSVRADVRDSDVVSFREFAASRSLQRFWVRDLQAFADDHLIAMTTPLPDGTSPLPSLTVLHMTGTSVTRAGLRLVNNLPSLEVLNLDANDLGHGGLNGLKDNSTIQVLQLSDTHIADNDVETLLTISNLKDVNLRNSGITDQGLLRLGSHPSLRRMFVGGDVSDATVKTLRARLDCQVLR
jgi:hypothetical protein